MIGRIGKVIDHNIEKLVEVIVETRAKHNQKAYIYCSSGEDSVPVKEDKILLIRVDGTGRNVMIGFLVPSQGAQPGEKIYFGRDQEGNITSKIKLLNDGSYTLDTDTETTGDATGDFIKIIKGETNIIERKDRTYLNEANVNKTIKEDETILIEKNRDTTIKENETILIEKDRDIIINENDTILIEKNKDTTINENEKRTVTGNQTIKVKGNCDLSVDGTINIKAAKAIVINGSTIDLN